MYPKPKATEISFPRALFARSIYFIQYQINFERPTDRSHRVFVNVTQHAYVKTKRQIEFFWPYPSCDNRREENGKKDTKRSRSGKKEKEKGEKESETDRQTEGETLAADDEKQIMWKKVEVEGACKSEERGLTRCRGGSQGTWEMHSSRCQFPHQAAHSGPTGPHHGHIGPSRNR